MLAPLPATISTTRESLRALVCFVVAPAGDDMPIATLADCAAFLGVSLTGDLPHVGKDLPPFEPDRPPRWTPWPRWRSPAWFSFGEVVLNDLRATPSATSHTSTTAARFVSAALAAARS